MSRWSVETRAAPNVAVYPPGARFGPRRAHDWEWVWILEGEARYLYKEAGESGELQLPCDHLLLCRPGARDEFIWSPHARTRHGFLHFTLAETPTQWSDCARWPRLRALGDDDITATLCRHLLTLGGEWDATKAQIESAATLLLAAFVTGQHRIGEAAPMRAPEAVERALAFLYARLDSEAAAPIALSDLASAACVTPEHLCRVFKSATGLTPLQTVKLARLDRAAILLSRSNYSVGEIGRLNGFVSPFHFSRAFKDEYGLTPRELRARIEAGEAMPMPLLVRRWRNSDGE